MSLVSSDEIIDTIPFGIRNITDEPAVVHGEEVDTSREQTSFRHSQQESYAKETGLVGYEPLTDGDDAPDEGQEW